MGKATEATRTHLQRLRDAEKILFRRLANEGVENGNIVWVPPGWGMAWFDRGLRFRKGGKPVHFSKLDGETLREMMSQFPSFIERTLDEQGVNVDPPPREQGPGAVHYLKMATSGRYRGAVRKSEKVTKTREALKALREKKEEQREALQELEKAEATMLAEGTEAHEQGHRTKERRLIGRMKELRRQINRTDTAVKFLGRQIEACETNLHNLQLVELAASVELPDPEELAENEVAAEEAVAATMACADAAADVGIDEDGELDAEEQGIAAEFAGKQPAEIAKAGDVEATDSKEDAEEDGEPAAPEDDEPEPDKHGEKTQAQ